MNKRITTCHGAAEAYTLPILKAWEPSKVSYVNGCNQSVRISYISETCFLCSDAGRLGYKPMDQIIHHNGPSARLNRAIEAGIRAKRAKRAKCDQAPDGGWMSEEDVGALLRFLDPAAIATLDLHTVRIPQPNTAWKNTLPEPRGALQQQDCRERALPQQETGFAVPAMMPGRFKSLKFVRYDTCRAENDRRREEENQRKKEEKEVARQEAQARIKAKKEESRSKG